MVDAAADAGLKVVPIVRGSRELWTSKSMAGYSWSSSLRVSIEGRLYGMDPQEKADS